MTARRGRPLRDRAWPAGGQDQRFLCRFRLECLDFAATQRPWWGGFSCAGCPDAEDMTVDELRAELAVMVRLIAAFNVRDAA